MVVKYGGAAMEDETLKGGFALDVAALRAAGVNVTVVHGGGNEITDLAERLGVKTEFVEGHRRTSEEMLDVATMVLAGRVNKDLVRRINAAGSSAIGLCGLDNNMVVARRRGGYPDLGLVGDVVGVKGSFLRMLMGTGLVPVVAPIAAGIDGESFNVNADVVAGAIASALDAEVLLYMSNIRGIEVEGRIAERLTGSEAERLIAGGTIGGGMIPKVRAAVAALEAGARAVRIVDGRDHRSLLHALGNPALGTTVARAQTVPA